MRYRLPSIHRYPAVEYIPLTPQSTAEGSGWPNLNYGHFSLMARDGKLGWGTIPDNVPREIQAQLRDLSPDQVVLVSLNFLIKEMMYRGSTVFIAAEERPEQIGVYVIPKRFFYKPSIVLEAYNLQEKKLAWTRLEL